MSILRSFLKSWIAGAIIIVVISILLFMVSRIYRAFDWDRANLDPSTNGNISLAAAALQSGKSFEEIKAKPSDVLDHPWDYVGKLFCSDAIFWTADDKPPGGPLSEAFGGGDASDMWYATLSNASGADDQPAPVGVEMLWMGRSKLGDDPKRGNICGVLVGRAEKNNERILVIVGSPDSYQTQFVAESPPPAASKSE